MATAGRWRWLPTSLFGQLMLVLGAGLLLAQLLSAAINVAERDRLVSGNFGLQPAQRIADVVTLLDRLGESERERVVAIFNLPPLVLSLHDQPRVPTASAQGWRRPLLAWLMVQLQRAEAAGAADDAQQLRRRIAIVEQATAAPRP